MTDTKYKKPTSIDEARTNYRYQGKIIVEAGGRIFTARSGEKAHKVLKKVKKKFPGEVPTISYLPRTNEVIVPTVQKVKKTKCLKRKKKSKRSK